MKEVTRIHIAKVSYDIELPAKKALQHYIDTLSGYANDASVVEDIEIRITEILAERGVAAQGVITTKDVEEVKAQLGDPSEFISEGDFATGPSEAAQEDLPRSTRKLYRDHETSLLGGVLSGIGTYFSINPVWVRLIFIALTFASFGFAVFVYILLWIILPAAKTTAQKLELRGIVVNAATIRHFGNTDEVDEATAKRLKRRTQILGVLIGLASILACLIFITGFVAITGYSFFTGGEQALPDYMNTPLIYSLALSTIALVISFFIVLAYAGFTNKFTKRIGITLLVIFITGALTGIATGVTIGYQSFSNEQAIRASIKTKRIDLAKEFAQTDKLVINNQAPMEIRYVESDSTYIEYSTLPGQRSSVKANVQDGKLVVTGAGQKWIPYAEYGLTIYGPKLSELTIEEGMVNAEVHTEALAISQKADTNLRLSGSVKDLTATIGQDAGFYAAGANVTNVTLTAANPTEVTLGTVKSLSVTTPESCAADSLATIEVAKILNETFMMNGSEQSSNTTRNDTCTEIVIGETLPGEASL